MSKKIFAAGAALAAAATLTAGVTSTTAGGPSDRTNTANSKPSHVDDSRVPTLLPRLFAVVNSDGSFVRGKGVVSINKLGTGIYDVRFNRGIGACSWQGTVGYGQFSGATGSAMITITGRLGTNNGLFVTTFNGSGGPADMPFHALVVCS